MVTITATDRSPAKNTSTTTVTVTGRPTTVFRYDADGNLLDDGLRSYTWDAANRLASVTVKPGVTLDGLTPGTYAFGYNAAGQRVSETVNGALTRRWVWEPGAAAPAAELNAAGTVALRRYYAAGEVRLEAQAAGLTPRAFYYTRDHLGSVREVLDHTGATVAAYDYDAYGRRATVTGGAAVGSEFGYTGHLTHAPTGLVLTLFRAYDPETGRWLSRDPIWESGGMNLYGYVGGSPWMAVDVWGLTSLDYTDGAFTNLLWTSPNVFTIHAHGSSGRLVGISREQLVLDILAAKDKRGNLIYKKGMPIVVYACHSATPVDTKETGGSDSRSLIQYLSDTLDGHPVVYGGRGVFGVPWRKGDDGVVKYGRPGYGGWKRVYSSIGFDLVGEPVKTVDLPWVRAQWTAVQGAKGSVLVDTDNRGAWPSDPAGCAKGGTK